MSSRQIEMTWKCSSCDHRNLGRFKVCQNCKNPKDGSEEWEMPEDTSKAASVTEESLLKMALAGPDWRCAYCGSDQRRTDKGCANCGADALEAEEPEEAEAPRRVEPPLPPITRASPLKGCLVVAGIVGACLASGAVFRWNKLRPRDFEARVTDVSWNRTITIERYESVAFEGFKEDMPTEAQNVKSLGKREHHHEQVFDHFETERYTEQVPDGYRTESYTERESCGQTCTTRPQSCREVCTSNKNGFATCRQSCSGGGESCTTKYCDVRKTRQIPKTRTENRTRQVSRYRSEPRYAEAFSWTHWVWRPNRTLTANGTDVTCRWPTSNLKKGLAPGEDEREQRDESFNVVLHYGDDDRVLSLNPTSEEEFGQYPPNSKHALRTENGRFILDGKEVSSATY